MADALQELQGLDTVRQFVAFIRTVRGHASSCTSNYCRDERHIEANERDDASLFNILPQFKCKYFKTLKDMRKQRHLLKKRSYSR